MLTSDKTGIPGGVVHDLPGDFEEVLKANVAALAAWQDITPLARNEWICWIEDAKKAESRAKRIRWVARTSATASAAHVAGRVANIGKSSRISEARFPSADIGDRKRCPTGDHL